MGLRVEISGEEYKAESNFSINQSAGQAASSSVTVRLAKGAGKDYDEALVHIVNVTDINSIALPDEQVGDIFEISFRGRKLN